MRRWFGSIMVGLALMLLPAGPVSAQSATAFLTASPTEFSQGENIGLQANFGSEMPYEYWGYVVAWYASLVVFSNDYQSTPAEDWWYSQCYYGGYCEGGTGYTLDPWLNAGGVDQGPGQTMEATSYWASGVAVYLVVTCTEGCMEQPWQLDDTANAQVTPQEEEPPCEVPFLPYKGLARGRTVLYGFTGQNIPNQQPFADGFDSWTSQNASTGVNVTYIPGAASPLSGIVVARGDAGFTDGLANYGSFDPTVSAGRVLGGSLVVSDRTDRVTTGDGFRRITQHELGHAHGLNHWANVKEKISVMRAPNTFDGAALADYVTPCDALRAFQREDN